MENKLSTGAGRITGEGAFKVLAKARKLENEGRRVLHFEIGEPDLETPAHIARAGMGAIESGKTHYVAPPGMPELREAVCEEVARTRGYRPSLEQVLIIPGLKPGIFFSLLATVDPGDEVLFPDPGFPTYHSVTAYLGAKPVPLPLAEDNDFRLDPAVVRSRLTPKSKVIIVNSPHNPTGAVMTREDMAEMAKIAKENDLFLISDEVYSKLVYGGDCFSPTCADRARTNSILLDGFSKNYAMTGWRLGYMVVPGFLAARLADFLVSAISCTPPFVQLAGLAALKGDQSFIPSMVDRFRERRDRLVGGLNALPGCHCLAPGGAFYAYPNIRGTGMTAQACADHLLLEAGVATLPGTAFGENGEGYLRFSYATTLEVIDEALMQLGKVLKS